MSEPSIQVEASTDSWNFYERLRVTGEVPFGSSFCVCADYTYTALDDSGFSGGGFMEGGQVFNSESEYLDQNISLEVLPNMSYLCWVFLCGLDQYGQADRNDRLTEDVQVTFTTEDLAFTPLKLDAPETFKPENGQAKALCFTPEKDGYYQIKLSGGDEGELLPWNAERGIWDYENSVSIGRQSSLEFSGSTGSPQYFRLNLYAPDESTASALTLTVTEFTPTVTDFSVTTGEANRETEIPGFSAWVPVEVEAPMESSFVVGLEVLRDGQFRQMVSRQISQTKQEHQTVEFLLDTLPGQTYQYRAYLTTEDANNGSGKTVYGQSRSFTADAFSPNTAVELVLDKETSGDAAGSQKEAVFYFTPDADGLYQVTLNGGDALRRGEEGFWTRHAGSSHVFEMKRGVTEFFCLSGRASDGQCTLMVSRYEPSPDIRFGAYTEKGKQDGLELSVPVKVSAPIGSAFRWGVRYCLGETMTDDVLGEESRRVSGSTAESASETFTIPVLPGRTYTYQAFLWDLSAGGKLYTGEAHTCTVPSAEEMGDSIIVLDPENSSGTAPTGPKNCYSFCPKEEGTYCFFSDGMEGDLTVLLEDGEWREFYYGYENAPPMTLYLKANTTVYLIHTERRSNSASLMVKRQPLTAVYTGGSVTVSLETSQAGNYIFAVYDASDKLLSLAVKPKESTDFETLTASLTGVSGGTAYVKVFTLDSAYRPVDPVEQLKVPRT